MSAKTIIKNTIEKRRSESLVDQLDLLKGSFAVQYVLEVLQEMPEPVKEQVIIDLIKEGRK